MNQKFTKQTHKNFIKYFHIKEKESKVEKKIYKKTIKYIKYIKWIPGLQMIGVGNSVSMNSAKKTSDIDLYIVTKKNRLWLVRIIITFVFQILGVRKNKKKHKERFCLSFFSTIDGMNFGKFAIKNDLYLYFWILYFKPILNYNNCYENFIKINSSWADFSNYTNLLEKNQSYIIYTQKTKNKTNFFLKYFLDFINFIFKKIFLRKTIKTYEKIGKPFGIIINDDLLKFHNNDIRKEIKKYLK